MTIVIWLVLGLVIGVLAKLLMPGRDGGGIIMTALLGIGGALLGGAIASAIGLASFTGFTLSGLVVAVLGAMLLLWGYRMLRRRTA